MGSWIGLIAAAGIGGIIVKVIETLSTRSTERRREERNAWVQRDREAKARRKLEEYAHGLRRILLRLGLKERAGNMEITEENMNKYFDPWPEYHINDDYK